MSATLLFALRCDHEGGCLAELRLETTSEREMRLQAHVRGWSHRLMPIGGFARGVDYCPEHAQLEHPGTIAARPNG